MRLLVLSVAGCLFSAFAGAQAPVNAQKVAFAQRILQRVGATYGFDVLELPKLVMYPKQNSKRVAYLELAPVSVRRTAGSLDRSRLLMDETLYDICLSVDGRSGAALAFVLAHEMAHFYHRHATYRSFAEQKDASMPEAESRRQEVEADQTGLLFAYLAGYDPEPVLDALFEKLYDQYGLVDPLPGHPSKPERKRAAKLRAHEFRTYGYLFAVGHALFCREKFAEAARCFEFVYARYPIKEAYNNFGVCRLQQIVRLKTKSPARHFALPFEVDPRNRLLRMSERGETTNAAELSTLSQEANAAFDRALQMDARYGPAYLNQAAGHLLADNPFLALGVLQQLTRSPGRPLPPNGYLIRGIAYCGLGDMANAERNFKAAQARRAYQADYNSHVFQSLKQGGKTVSHPWQRLRAPGRALTAPGCQAGAVPLEEADDVPAALRFGLPLIEQNTPPPFIVVDYGQTDTETYFRVKLNANDERTRQPDLFFVRRTSANPSGR